MVEVRFIEAEVVPMILYTTEILRHYSCGKCGKWWSVADQKFVPRKQPARIVGRNRKSRKDTEMRRQNERIQERNRCRFS